MEAFIILLATLILHYSLAKWTVNLRMAYFLCEWFSLAVVGFN